MGDKCPECGCAIDKKDVIYQDYDEDTGNMITYYKCTSCGTEFNG
jgi:DNA-directed RNA polymerase subunit RPC12/RpoP